MRRIFIGIICMSLLSCQGQHSNNVNDSLLTDTNLTAQPPKTYPDSIQKKIIGDIYFEIDKKTFDRLSNAFQKAHLKNKRYHLGNFQYLLINPELYNPWVETEDELKQTIQGAYDLVVSQYGKPDSTHNGVIGKGNDEDLFVWHIGHKRIKIISGYSFNMFTVTLRFENVLVTAQIQADDRKRRDSLTRSNKKDI